MLPDASRMISTLAGALTKVSSSAGRMSTLPAITGTAVGAAVGAGVGNAAGSAATSAGTGVASAPAAAAVAGAGAARSTVESGNAPAISRHSSASTSTRGSLRTRGGAMNDGASALSICCLKRASAISSATPG